MRVASSADCARETLGRRAIEVSTAPTPNEIKREGASRRIDVTCNVAGRDLGAVARDLEARLATVKFPPAHHPELLGEYKERHDSSQRLMWLTFAALVGFVTVLGIAARNGIMLVSHFRHLETEEGESFRLAMILRGAEERLAPILMTASCAGLVTSTLLNVFLLPALYARFARSSVQNERATTTP